MSSQWFRGAGTLGSKYVAKENSLNAQELSLGSSQASCFCVVRHHRGREAEDCQWKGSKHALQSQTDMSVISIDLGQKI